MAKPPDRSVKAPAETSRVTTAKPAGKEVRRKNKRNAVAPPPTAIELPLTGVEPSPALVDAMPPDAVEAAPDVVDVVDIAEPPSLLVETPPPPHTIEPAPDAVEPLPILADSMPPDAVEPSPDAVEPPAMPIEPPHAAVEPPPMLAESTPPDAVEPSPMLAEPTPPDAVEPSPMLAESEPPDAVEPPAMLAESTPSDVVEPPPMPAETTPPGPVEPVLAVVADPPAVAEHAHEVLVRLTDEEHQALATACAALTVVGQKVSIEDMIRTLVERWMAATRAAATPDVPVPAYPRMLDAIRAQLRWLVAQPVRRWHELRLALRRWTRALAA